MFCNRKYVLNQTEFVKKLYIELSWYLYGLKFHLHSSHCFKLKVCIPPVHSLQLINLWFKSFKCHLYVKSSVFCFKDVENNCIFFTVRIFCVAALIRHFERFPAMISTNFDMDLIFKSWLFSE